MKTAIIFTTNHGTTEKVARYLSEKMHGTTDLIPLKKVRHPEIGNYDRIILGGSIHVGMIQKRMRKFIEANLPMLLQKELGLYICCMEPNKFQEEFEAAFPEEIKQAAKAKAILGGEFCFEKMNFIEKIVVKKVAGVTETVSQINWEAADRFAEELKR